MARYFELRGMPVPRLRHVLHKVHPPLDHLIQVHLDVDDANVTRLEQGDVAKPSTATFLGGQTQKSLVQMKSFRVSVVS